MNCARCDENQIACDNACLPDFLRCDGERDCSDGRDETDCVSAHCAQDQFPCKSGTCIDKHYRCDGSPDCADNSDEENCSVCPLSHFLCHTGRCVSQVSEPNPGRLFVCFIYRRSYYWARLLYTRVFGL